MGYPKYMKEMCEKLYKDGLSTTNIAKKTGVGKSTVARWVDDAGLSRKTRRTGEELEEFKSKIKNMYNKGMYSYEIAEFLGVDEGIIAYHVNRMGIARHRGVKSMVEKEDYFDIIDTEEKAYWLGFIMADGNVSEYNGQHFLKISLAVRDKSVLIAFAKAIGSANSIYETDEVFKMKSSSSHGKTFTKCSISISSKHMVESLIRNGVKPSKTGEEHVPSFLNKDLTRHFIRGFFDGDGTAYVTQPHYTRSGKYASISYGFGFISNKSMLEEIQKHVGEKSAINKKDGCYSFEYGKKKGRTLYEYMYKDANVWLPRKKEVMDMVYENTELIDGCKRLPIA